MTKRICAKGDAICIPSNYSKFDLPNETMTVVHVGIDIKDIPKIDDQEYSITLNAFFVVRWTDKRMIIDGDKMDQVRNYAGKPREDICPPDTFKVSLKGNADNLQLSRPRSFCNGERRGMRNRLERVNRTKQYERKPCTLAVALEKNQAKISACDRLQTYNEPFSNLGNPCQAAVVRYVQHDDDDAGNGQQLFKAMQQP